MWADTCCIDKTSSAELSEAINSMFTWYKRSQICFAFCEDVGQSSIHLPDMRDTGNASEKNFAASRWFTRGWTLQELIAPKEVMFYNKYWVKIGEKSKNSELIGEITGIDTFILEGGPLPEVSVGRRMSWAVGRQTTREEDIAYSLMGLFDINMPLLYGEGPKAFIRLQEEILRKSDDHTLFAWRSAPESIIRGTASGLLADHPRNFRNFRGEVIGSSTDIHGVHTDHNDHIVRVWDHRTPQDPITITNMGIRITCRLVDLYPGKNPDQFMILILNCSPGGNADRATGIYIRRQYEDRYARVRTTDLANVRLRNAGDHTRYTIHFLETGEVIDQPWTTSLDIRQESLASSGLQGQKFDGNTALQRRGQNYLQIRHDSFKANTIFGGYILYGVGIWQAHGSWRFFRFDHHDKYEDAIFDPSPGREFFLLFRTPDDLDLLVLTLGADTVSRNHWVKAVCVDKDELAREGADMAKTLKGIRKLSQEPLSYLNENQVIVAGKSLYIKVWFRSVLVEDLPMHRIQLAGPWPYSWYLIWKRAEFSITVYTVYLVVVLSLIFAVHYFL